MPATPITLRAQPFQVRCGTVFSEELAFSGAFADRNVGREEAGKVTAVQ